MKKDEVMNMIIDIFYSHKERYGYRRITLELTNRGYLVNHRLMSVMGLYGKIPTSKYKSYKGVMNGTTKNLVHEKVVDEECIKRLMKENL